MARVKLALIGCGGMSATHLQRFHLLSDRLRLVAAVDIDETKARQVQEHLPGVVVATDYRSVLDQVDAVLIVLPHHLHHAVAKHCLEAGKHVLLEKPMANSEAECLDLIAIAARLDRILMVAYCMRFHPVVAAMKSELDQKSFGEVFQVSIWTEQMTRYPPGHWGHRAATLGGGQLFSHGCHYIDILLWYLGEPVSGTHLGTNTGTPWMEREGTSNVTMRFAGNRLGYHFGTWGARGTRLRYAIHAHCSEGMIEADITRHRLLAHVGGERKLLMESEAGGKHTENEMAHFIDCIDRRQTPLTDGTASLQSLRVIWRLYEAEQRGVVADLRGLGLPLR
jgi:predicted dehydrogenase